MGALGSGDIDGLRREDIGDFCGGYGVYDAGERGVHVGYVDEHQGLGGANRTQHRKREKGQFPQISISESFLFLVHFYNSCTRYGYLIFYFNFTKSSDSCNN